jgi:DNA gyrase inhibitor GyrI
VKIEVEERPETRIACIRHFGEYGLEATLKTLARLLRWAGPRSLLESGRILGIPWNNPKVTAPEECCYDACVTVSDEFEVNHPIVFVQTLSAGTYLVRTCECRDGDLETPWQEFLAWYEESEWEMTGEACFEVYLNNSCQDATGNWSLELNIPVLSRR